MIRNFFLYKWQLFIYDYWLLHKVVGDVMLSSGFGPKRMLWSINRKIFIEQNPKFYFKKDTNIQTILPVPTRVGSSGNWVWILPLGLDFESWVLQKLSWLQSLWILRTNNKVIKIQLFLHIRGMCRACKCLLQNRRGVCIIQSEVKRGEYNFLKKIYCYY